MHTAAIGIRGYVSDHSGPNRRLDFESVCMAELPVLYRVAKRLTLNGDDAEDLVGSALLKAARGWAQFDGAHPRSWLIRILRNEHLSVLRKSNLKSEATLEDISEPSDDGFWEEIAWRAVGDDIFRALDALPVEYRMAVTLCDVEEMSYEEASAAMDVPVGTVRSRLFRGRRLLRAKLVHSADLEAQIEEAGR